MSPASYRAAPPRAVVFTTVPRRGVAPDRRASAALVRRRLTLRLALRLGARPLFFSAAFCSALAARCSASSRSSWALPYASQSSASPPAPSGRPRRPSGRPSAPPAPSGRRLGGVARACRPAAGWLVGPSSPKTASSASRQGVLEGRFVAAVGDHHLLQQRVVGAAAPRVDRLDVEEAAVERHRQQVAVLDVRVGASAGSGRTRRLRGCR